MYGCCNATGLRQEQMERLCDANAAAPMEAEAG
jgi:hypothetical protein